MLLFILTSLIIFFSFYCFCSRLSIQPLSVKLVVAGLFYFAQIILSLLFLGIAGLLTTSWVIALNLTLSVSGIIFSTRNHRLLAIAQKDVRSILNFLYSLSWENKTLLIFCAIATAWIGAAVYLLPPRGVDDLAYHLPRVYEYWQNHKIFLLPVNIFANFAFPENADLLFLWPIVFFQNQQWVEGGQLVFGIYGVLVLFTLARLQKLSPRTSAFLAFSFFLTPVVLCQMGTNYIEVITAVTYLTAVFCALRFREQGEIIFLYAAALSAGLGAGMKYGMIPLVIYLLIFILPAFRRVKRAHIFGYLLVMLIAGGFWYLRNLIILHEIFYPGQALANNFKLVDTADTNLLFMAWDAVKSLSDRLSRVILQDTWLATYNAGLGSVFLGVALPCWLMAFPGVFQDAKKKNFTRLFLWLNVPLGFSFILSWRDDLLVDVIRYALFIIPFGLIFLGETLELWKKEPRRQNGVRLLCVLLSFLSLTTVPGSFHPGYRIDAPLIDRWQNNTTSEFKYLTYGGWVKPSLRWVAEPLDFITRDNKKGLLCYVAGNSNLAFSTVYGSRLQNRVWNFGAENDQESPEAFIFINFPNQAATFNNQETARLLTALRNPDLSMVSASEYVQLLISKKALKAEGRQQQLLRYYQITFPAEIQAGYQITKAIKQDIPIVVSNRLGLGLRYLELKGKLNNPLFFIPARLGKEFTRTHNWPIAYSLENPLPGYKARLIQKFPVKDKQISLWENIRENDTLAK